MKRLWAILPGLALLVVVAPGRAQPWADQDPFNGTPNLNGRWFNSGDPNKPCYIQERPDGHARFTNENGSHARGVIRGDQVWIPDWSPGNGIQGLQGAVQGDRIVWPNGSYWSRAGWGP